LEESPDKLYYSPGQETIAPVDDVMVRKAILFSEEENRRSLAHNTISIYPIISVRS
jgi:hypothetical protein